MEYMILIYSDERAWKDADEAKLKAMYAEYGSYTQDLMKAGVMRGGSELKPASICEKVSHSSRPRRSTCGRSSPS